MLMCKPQDPLHNGECLADIQTGRHIIDFDYRMKSFVSRIGKPKTLLGSQHNETRDETHIKNLIILCFPLLIKKKMKLTRFTSDMFIDRLAKFAYKDRKS